MPNIIDDINSLSSFENLKINSNTNLFACYLAARLSENKNIIFISESKEGYKNLLKSINFFLKPQKKAFGYLTDDCTPFHKTASDPFLAINRNYVNFQLSLGNIPNVLLLDKKSLLLRCAPAKHLEKYAIILEKQQKVNRDELIFSLHAMGYTKVPSVIDKGTFSVRGSIIDIFANGSIHPLRIDLFGDEIEFMKFFNPQSQKSEQEAFSIVIGPMREIYFDQETKELAEKNLSELADQINYPTKKLNQKINEIKNDIYFFGIEKLLPAFLKQKSSILENYLLSTSDKPIIIFEQKNKIYDSLNYFHKELNKLHEMSLKEGDLAFNSEQHYLNIEEITSILNKFPNLDIDNFAQKSDYNIEVKPILLRQEILQESMAKDISDTHHLLRPLANRIKQYHDEKIAVLIVLSAKEDNVKLREMLSPFKLGIYPLKESLVWDKENILPFKNDIHAYTVISKNIPTTSALFNFLNIAIITEEEIFGKRKKSHEISGKQQGFNTSLSDLNPGDFVVHVDHGIAKFNGLTRLNLSGVINDYVLLNYANDEKLYLPVHHINLIKPYSTSNDINVRLDKLGSNLWQSKKTKVKQAVISMAEELIKLYAKRELVERTPFFPPCTHFLEFEANFQFETTIDQQKAIDDVINDMQKNKPMDRLVCGDVGYGKTEVAMRAAMLSVLSKRQVAILAPTTLLAQQHGLTFTERFKNTGVIISVISRFQSTKEIKQTLEDLAKGNIDILIGTHRLLSPDVNFKNLGLLVIDEEQRFGIKAKEHFRKMRARVDVLAMSATPIPRTLQMSYFGIRDLSIIETPPVDRRAIQTYITQFDDAVIKEAIIREVSRGGQVYFVHNRVQNIDAMADYIKTLVPSINIGVVHGQMDEEKLEEQMLSFLRHEINVLVCTTIIETGIDVSTANTMFINNADDFGLSQLYQLRGRIGRSKERAFAYLLTKTENESLNPLAKARLEILYKFSELGTGFRIAQHDLELRGAGDLLGKNQHGHMAAVGYDLYSSLLKEAVITLRGKSIDDDIMPEISIPISAMIPEDYCPDLHERMALYQRLAMADTQEQLMLNIEQIIDVYGMAPPELLALREISLLKLRLKEIKALKLESAKMDNSYSVAIQLGSHTPIDHNKVIEIIKNNKNIRITPQNKVIQTIKINEIIPEKALFNSCNIAIDNLKSYILTI